MNNLRFDLDPHQTRAFRMVKPGRTLVLPWGRGSGKTFFGRAVIHSLALQKQCRIGLLYPSLKQGKEIIWDGPTGLFGDFEYLRRQGVVRRYHRSELYAEYANGSRLSTWGAENADSIRGQRFDAVISDETDDISPDVETAIVEPTFSKSGRDAIYIKTGTPRRGRHGALFASYSDLLEQEQHIFRNEQGERTYDAARTRTVYGFRLRSADSPQVDRVWLAGVRSKLFAQGKSSTYKREYECDFDAAEGLVYPHFDLGVHVRDAHPNTRFHELLIGCDYGFEAPGVMLVIGVTGSGPDAQCWILEEVYEPHQTESWWVLQAQRLEQVYGQRYQGAKRFWYHDPSAAGRIDALKSGARIHIDATDNKVEDGVNFVMDSLIVQQREGAPWSQLYVSPDCVNTIREFGMYRRKRDPKNTETILDDILKKDDHAMDSLRYALYNRFGGIDRRIGGGYGHA